MPLRGLSSRVSVAGRFAGPADMNRRVTFYSPGVRSKIDGTTGPPQAAFECWAALYAVAGAEIDRAQQIAQKVSHLVVINYQLGVKGNMTIQYLDAGITRTFQIAAIDDPDEQRWQLKVYCFEIGQNAGGAS
jgi:SPP1 family predicted phage head-tail adaptor